MKKNILILTIILLAIVVIDLAFGVFIRSIEPYSYNQNSICAHQFNSDVLILGSSASVFDLSPNTIEEQLDLSCYCGGEGANGCLVAWARYNMCIRRHTPKIVIYCITPEYDYHLVDEGEYARNLNILQDYFLRDSVIDEMFREFKTPLERIKLYSNMVRYNPSWVQTVTHAATQSKKNAKGHGSFYGTFTPFKVAPERMHGPYEPDTVKMKYLTQLFTDITARDITLFCVIPPVYYDTYDPEKYQPAYDLCHQLNIPVINHYYTECISGHPEYFFDSVHLNEIGCQVYTQLLCQEILQILSANALQ